MLRSSGSIPSTGALLELNYDACHVADWRAKHDETKRRMPERMGEFKVFRSVIEGHRRKQNIRMQLPVRVQAVLRKPSDETSWTKLEEVRKAVVAEIQCERQFHFTSDELEGLQKSIRVNSSRQRCFDDEVGKFERKGGLDPVPTGSRILVTQGRNGTADEVLDLLSMTTEYEPLRIQLRPLGTKREQTLDEFGKLLCVRDQHIKDIAATKRMSKEECLDKMLLVLWDALMLTMCEGWTRGNVANMHVCEAPQLARYFVLGLQVGANPLFDGICAMCGALLYGAYKGAHTNRYYGPPSDRDGHVIADTTAQPPFLLRYSPQLFAKEAPTWFEHDPETNRLSLRPGVPKPWVRQPVPSVQMDESRPWLYCIDCKDRYFADSGERGTHSHIPYRDRASTHFMKPVRKRRYWGGAQTTQQDEDTQQQGEQPKEQQQQPEEQSEHDEPEIQQQDDGLDDDFGIDDTEKPCGQNDELLPATGTLNMEDDEDDHLRRTRFEQSGYVPNLPDAPVSRPTLVEYQARWDVDLAKHMREVPGAFSRDNLVPKPIQELWQDVPYVPFDKLRSTDAQARLSVCRPRSALEEPNVRSGVGRYAHLTGDERWSLS